MQYNNRVILIPRYASEKKTKIKTVSFRFRGKLFIRIKFQPYMDSHLYKPYAMLLYFFYTFLQREFANLNSVANEKNPQ